MNTSLRRRDLLKTIPFFPPLAQRAASAAGPMKITKVEMVRVRRDLRIHEVSPN